MRYERSSLCWVLPKIVFFGCCSAVLTAADLPYAAFVCEDVAVVRSGPGEEFYATRDLQWGTRVDVYRHDGAYAAIRPPEGSFSWVPAEAVKVGQDQTTATVQAADVKTRIGSTEADRWDAEYVTLNVGERVEVLGLQTVESPDGAAQDWVKVTPPAGEFRWVSLRQLQKAPPVREVSQAKRKQVDKPAFEEVALDEHPDGAEALAEQEDGTSEEFDLKSDLPLEDLETTGAEMVTELDTGTTSDERQAALAQWAYEMSPKQQLPPRLGSPPMRPQEVLQVAMAPEVASSIPTDDGQVSDLLPPPTSSSPFGFSDVTPRADSVALRNNAVTPEYLERQLTHLDVAVSQEICKPTAQWQLEAIHTRCSAVIDVADSAEVRQRAQSLLAKIVQFDDVRRRELRLNAQLSSQPVGNVIASMVPAGPDTPPATPPSLYDGAGWLMPVLTNRTDVPRYVLTDDEGQVLQFVSPKPGLNLNRYERKKVGVFGQRGYLPSVSQPHLMAERIVSLDKVR